MEIIIFTGNIGSGKSTLAQLMAKKGFVVISEDAIVSMIGGGDYTLYDESKKYLYKEIENTAIYNALRDGFSVIVDGANMDARRRSRYISIAKKFKSKGIKIKSYNWGKGNNECIINRMKDDRGYTKEYWNDVYIKHFNDYENPSLSEGFDDIIELGIE